MTDKWYLINEGVAMYGPFNSEEDLFAYAYCCELWAKTGKRVWEAGWYSGGYSQEELEYIVGNEEAYEHYRNIKTIEECPKQPLYGVTWTDPQWKKD